MDELYLAENYIIIRKECKRGSKSDEEGTEEEKPRTNQAHQ